MPEKFNATDVFTPTTPARLTFVERDSINDKLVNSLKTPGKQIVVYGHSGSGKTTLLENKLHQVYENHITSRCIKGVTFDQLVIDAFDQLGVFYVSEKTDNKKYKITSSISAEYKGIKAQIGSESEKDLQQKRQRVVPPQLTPQTLAKFLGEVNCCWVLEDFHKVDAEEKIKLAQVMKVFMDMADHYRDLRIIAIGAVNTARQVVEADSEMKNRVAEIYVPLMNDKEALQIIEKGEKLLNFSVASSVRNLIVKYSNGLPAVCHQLCLNICFAANIVETKDTPVFVGENIFTKAVQNYLEEASDTLKAAFSKAFKRKRVGKFDNGRLIVQALAKCEQDGASHGEIYNIIKITEQSYPASNLKHYLQELQQEERGAILRYDSSSGQFAFSDPVYRAFAMTMFDAEKNQRQTTTIVELKAIEFDLDKVYKQIIENLNRATEKFK